MLTRSVSVEDLGVGVGVTVAEVEVVKGYEGQT